MKQEILLIKRVLNNKQEILLIKRVLIVIKRVLNIETSLKNMYSLVS